MTEKIEAVVVGAGTAGSAAAYELARNGIQTLLLERGKFPGSKNVTGGVLYGDTRTQYNLDYLIPEFEKQAPVERKITKVMLHSIADKKGISQDVTLLDNIHRKFSYSVLRAKFDKWFADSVDELADKTGGGVLSSIHVRDIVEERGEIVGVSSDELDDIYADVIIAADGVNSEIARRAGLRSWFPKGRLYQGVKVVMRMSSKLIEERFNIAEDEGAAHFFAGDLFEGILGGGFLYTNRDSLSIGNVFHLDSMEEKGVEPDKLLDRLLLTPIIRKLIENNYDELEYSAHLIPDGKKCVMQKPWRDRLLVIGDAAGHMYALGPAIKGMNLGITAGILAAKAYLDAKKKDSTNFGERYEQYLRDSYVMSDLTGIKTRIGQRMIENNFFYAKLPTVTAKLLGRKVETEYMPTLKSIDDRIGRLKYETDIGRAHIKILDDSTEGTGKCIPLCPTYCYRSEKTVDRNGTTMEKVVLDTQPCVECGTCAVLGEVEWHHPRGGKGVNYEYG